MKVLAVLIAIAATSAGCTSKKKATTEQVATAQIELNEPSRPNIPPVQMMEFASFETGDPYTIEAVSREGDALQIMVQYSGGCKDHEFVLFADPRIMKSMPPQQNLVLVHNANEDHCRALITDTLRFNLSPLRQGQTGTIILRLHNSEERIQYAY
jgi:hypothetical protein